MNWMHIAQQIGLSAVFTLLGVALLALTFVIVQKLLPFSIRKELEEDQNVALGIVVGSAILAAALIISAAIQG